MVNYKLLQSYFIVNFLFKLSVILNSLLLVSFVYILLGTQPITFKNNLVEQNIRSDKNLNSVPDCLDSSERIIDNLTDLGTEPQKLQKKVNTLKDIKKKYPDTLANGLLAELEKGNLDINESLKVGLENYTPLLAALLEDRNISPNTIDLFITSGAEVINAPYWVLALRNTRSDLIERLIDHGLNPDVKFNGMSLTQLAFLSGNLQAVEVLQTRGYQLEHQVLPPNRIGEPLTLMNLISKQDIDNTIKTKLKDYLQKENDDE